MQQGLSLPVILIVGVLIALGIGFTNSQVVLRVGLPSFITSLGMMMSLRGLVLALSKGFLLPFTGDEVAKHLLAGTITGFFRFSVIWSLLICGIFGFILVQTRYGNWSFASGGNKNAARMAGIPVERVKTINFLSALYLLPSQG